jgi:hypothetical protein
VTVHAGSIVLDGRGAEPGFTRISSSSDASGDAGRVVVTVDRDLDILPDGRIGSDGLEGGSPGSVTVGARNISIDGTGPPRLVTGISTVAKGGGTRNGGSLDVEARETLTISNGESSSAITNYSGLPGSIHVVARDLTLKAEEASELPTTITSATFGAGDAGNVVVDVKNALTLLQGASISADTLSASDAGTVTVSAGGIILDGNGDVDRPVRISASTIGAGHGGDVTVTAVGDILIRASARITAEAYARGNAGPVEVDADNITIDGAGLEVVTGITSDTLLLPSPLRRATGNAGDVLVAADHAVKVLGGVRSRRGPCPPAARGASTSTPRPSASTAAPRWAP